VRAYLSAHSPDSVARNIKAHGLKNHPSVWPGSGMEAQPMTPCKVFQMLGTNPGKVRGHLRFKNSEAERVLFSMGATEPAWFDQRPAVSREKAAP
jgi:hypothetical protein